MAASEEKQTHKDKYGKHKHSHTHTERERKEIRDGALGRLQGGGRVGGMGASFPCGELAALGAWDHLASFTDQERGHWSSLLCIP